jgi:hypothetical protein
MGHKTEVRRKGRKGRRKDWEGRERHQLGQGGFEPKKHGGEGEAAVTVSSCRVARRRWAVARAKA